MEEVESEEFIDFNFNNAGKSNISKKYNKFSFSDDTIPHLIKPSKHPLSIYTSMSYLISNIPKMNLEQERIQRVPKNKKSLYIINQNLQKYNSNPLMKRLMLIDDLIHLKGTHYTSVFKDYLISDFDDEFLRGYFNIEESIKVLPKFYDYYKNYLKFFCKGTFNSFYVNDIIQEYGENKAEVYYNINYKKKERTKKKDKKGNIDEKNFEQSDKSKSNQNDNMSNLISLNCFFTKSVEFNIKNIIKLKEKESKVFKKKNKELSNIKPSRSNNKNNTINLPDNSSVSIDDALTKKSSIINLIDLMNNKAKNNKKNAGEMIKSNKKIQLILIDNKKLINNKNILNKKRFNSFSKTTSNLNNKVKTKTKEINKKNKKIINRNKGNNIKINNIISKNNKILSSSNYIKYIDILKNKKNIKGNISRNKIPQNELILTSSRIIKNKKVWNNNPSFNTNENYNFNVLSNSNITNNIKNSKRKNCNINRINLSLKVKNFHQKIKKINNSTSLHPLSTSKGHNSKKNIYKKSEQKKKGKSKSNKNTTNNFYFTKNQNSKKIKGFSFSPKNIYYHNKSLSYSTVNNCNININNNIILPNNYFNNNKFSPQGLNQVNNTSKKKLDKNIIKKKFNINNNNNTRPLTSRNIKIDLDKFRTEENIVNSIILQGTTSHRILKNKNNENNIHYTSFRKANNHEILIKQRNLFKLKKSNLNMKSKKQLTLKEIPIMSKTKSNLVYNNNNSSKKIYVNEDISSISKGNKNLYKKNNNNNSNQNKIIFDYKKK